MSGRDRRLGSAPHSSVSYSTTSKGAYGVTIFFFGCVLLQAVLQVNARFQQVRLQVQERTRVNPVVCFLTKPRGFGDASVHGLERF
jgi:hypothetical protein